MPYPDVSPDALRSPYGHAPLMMGVVELGGDGIRHLSGSAAVGPFPGVPPETIQGRLSGAEIGAPPEVLECWQAACRRCLAEGRPVQFAYAHAAPEGERWLSVAVSPTEPGPDGSARCLYVVEGTADQRRADDDLRDATARLGALFDRFQGSALVEDPDGRIALANRALCDLLGEEVEPDRLVGRPGADVLRRLEEAAADADVFRDWTGQSLRGGSVHGEDLELRDGRTLECDVVPIEGGAGRFLGRLWTFVDVTDNRREARRLEESEARYRLLAESTRDLVALHDVEGRFTWVSPSCRPLLGYEPGDLLGVHPYDLFHPDDRARAESASSRGPDPGRASTVRARRKDGGYVWFETLWTEVLDDGGAVAGYQTVSRDVTERCEMEAALIREAHYDALTGLPNRVLFRTHLHRRCVEPGAGPFGVLFIALDRFKVVNDTFGHEAGDALLREVGARLARCVRREDTVARFGGDEFAVLLDSLSAGAGQALADRVQHAIAAPVEVEGQRISVTASVGVLEVHEEDPAPDELLRASDLAMSEAKRRGRATHVVFDAAMEAAATRRLRLEVDLPHAAARGELSLVYQPIVSLADGGLVALEALLRWAHPELGAVGPSEFVAIAEESGFATELDAWVLDEGCRQMRAWEDAVGRPLPFALSVNTSGFGLRKPGEAERVLATLRRHGIGADRLQLEITERLFIDRPDAVSAVLERLRGHGVRIALDDFGTGYSSLRLLHVLPVDVVKIDRSFIGRMDNDPQAEALVEAVVRISDVLGKAVVAEGIETSEQLEILRNVGDASGQGFLLARPLPVSDVAALLGAGPAPWTAYWGGAVA